jgi:hypothetical protein
VVNRVSDALDGVSPISRYSEDERNLLRCLAREIPDYMPMVTVNSLNGLFHAKDWTYPEHQEFLVAPPGIAVCDRTHRICGKSFKKLLPRGMQRVRVGTVVVYTASEYHSECFKRLSQ